METEYESDPEEAKLSLSMRRREASDDEGEEEKNGRPRRNDSDAESDGQGGAEEYYEDELDVDEEEYDDGEIEVAGIVEDGKRFLEREKENGGEGVVTANGAVGGRRALVGEVAGSVEGDVLGDENQIEGEQKKEHEPFSVPTAGAFYMHDDRFRDNAGGQNRKSFNGKKLWESKDNRKWGHDKFEELTIRGRQHEQGRRVSRGRGNNAVSDRGYARGNMSQPYTNGNNINQNQAPKSVRGRGPRRYEPAIKNKNEAPTTLHKQPGRPHDKSSHKNSGSTFAPTSNAEFDPVPPRKNMAASSLSSASPPFYPSGASNKDVSLASKRDAQPGNTNKNLRRAAMGESFPIPQSNAVPPGSNVGSVGVEKLYNHNNYPRGARKPSSSVQFPPSGPFINNTQAPQYRTQGKGSASSGQRHLQPSAPQNQTNRATPRAHVHGSPDHSQAQHSVQSVGQRTGNGSHGSSPQSAAPSIKSFESVAVELTPESSKSKNPLVAKAKGGIQGNGGGSLLYNGAQIMGVPRNMGGGRGDQNFPGAPTFLPVMQFGGQHPGGMGVPAVGMAFPGYVGQPQGMGNSEMTWLPVLAGAAGALGASYCPPYMTVDGAYHALPSGQMSSMGTSSKEITEASNDYKPSQRPELVGDEFGQRQNKPRRYSEMNFGQ